MPVTAVASRAHEPRHKPYLASRLPHLEEATQFVKTLSEPGDLIADLFVGTGTIPAAVATVGEGRRFVGCEIDGDLVKAARRRVREALKERTSPLVMSAASV